MNRLSFALTGIALLGIDLSAVAAQAAEVPPGMGEPIEIHKNLPTDMWPQLQNTPQRTGYTPMNAAPVLQLKWQKAIHEDYGRQRHGFTDIYIGTTVQVIVGGGNAYVGTWHGEHGGVMFAFDAKTGEIRWQFECGGPILNTAGYADGKVFFGAMDGCVYALDVSTGKPAWVFNNQRRFGFGAAVLLAEDKVFIADRGGYLFALNQTDGKKVWHYDAGFGVVQSAAYNKGNVYLGSEDTRVHAVKAGDGSPVWKSKKLAGLGFRSNWPVVIHDRVLVWSLNYGSYSDITLFENAWKDPMKRAMHILDEKTGEALPSIEHYTAGHSGPVIPGSVTRDGLLVADWHTGDMFPRKGKIAEWKQKHANDRRKMEEARLFPYKAMGKALVDVRSGNMVRLVQHTPVGEYPEGWRHGMRSLVDSNLGPTDMLNEVAVDEIMRNTVFGDKITIQYRGGFRWAYFEGFYDLSTGQWHKVYTWQNIWCNTNYGWNRSEGCGAGLSAADGLVYTIQDTNSVECYEPVN